MATLDSPDTVEQTVGLLREAAQAMRSVTMSPCERVRVLTEHRLHLHHQPGRATGKNRIDASIGQLGHLGRGARIHSAGTTTTDSVSRQRRRHHAGANQQRDGDHAHHVDDRPMSMFGHLDDCDRSPG